jgi:hypothetical protein
MHIAKILLALSVGAVLAVPCAADAQKRSSGGSVSVRGYVRKDGTYVPPHRRSAPDGNFSNNWSTRGNVNPYTGKEGTKDLPARGGASLGAGLGSAPPLPNTSRIGGLTTPRPSTRVPAGTAADWIAQAERRDREFRERLAKEIQNLGGTANATESWADLSDRKSRILKARDLQRIGLHADWKTESWSAMQDRESRHKKAKDLERLGLQADPAKMSWAQMNDMESRFRKAADLKRLGIEVDWKQHTWAQMNDMESRFRKAADLKRLGIEVNWKQHTWAQMNDMERRLKGR